MSLLRLGKSIAELVDLRAQVVLPLAGSFQFFLDRLPLVGIQVGLVDVLLHRVDLVAADALLQRIGQAGVDHLRETAQLLLDVLRLADQRPKDAVFRPLLVDEVMAVDLVIGLELAVDAAVALLHAAGVPRNVEVEEVPAVGLEVEALAGGVGGDQDADRVFGRVAVERLLDLLALVGRRGAVVDRDPLLGPVGALDRRRKAARGGSAWCRRTR